MLWARHNKTFHCNYSMLMRDRSFSMVLGSELRAWCTYSVFTVPLRTFSEDLFILWFAVLSGIQDILLDTWHVVRIMTEMEGWWVIQKEHKPSCLEENHQGESSLLALQEGSVKSSRHERGLRHFIFLLCLFMACGSVLQKDMFAEVCVIHWVSPLTLSLPSLSTPHHPASPLCSLR